MIEEQELGKTHFIVSVKEQNMRDMKMFVIEVVRKKVEKESIEAVYDYCLSHNMVILYLNRISQTYYKTCRCDRISLIDNEPLVMR